MNSGPPPLPTPAPIRFSYRESGDHLLAGREEAAPSRKFAWGLWPIIIPAILLLVIYRSWLAGHRSLGVDWKDLAVGIGCVVLPLSLLLLIRFSPAITRTNFRRAYRKHTGRDESTVAVELGDAALFISTEGGAASQYAWNTIVRVVERPAGLLVYHGAETYFWFPRTAFASEDDYAAAKRLLPSKVADFRKSS